ncbi:complex I subunit 5 family protein [Caminicella sporogenes]|uniref:complex I subunit 5 family protein n=1 Tax=Caminicella sporogenes TaxID=166485 RepID=UPI0025411DC1|nr:proton-conducting transporter membrane subunit [Caminicella sporogenes]WIF95855.1 proton-conducting transporter membrane subunit [Caminicella sporogenes]
MDIIKNFPLLIIIILFISAFSMPIMRKKKLVKSISLASMMFSTILSVLTFIYVKEHGGYVYRVGHFDAPWGIELQIGIIEAIMSILFTFISSIIIWYSLYSSEKEIKDSKISLYYTLINILIGALLGIVYTNDIFNAFVFIEISTIGACGIIVVKDKKENIKATLKYLILSSVGSGLILMGIAFIYSFTGNLNMTFINKEIMKVGSSYGKTMLIALGLFTAGLGVKSAMFPMHVWLPDAHSNAPSTSSAILSALVLKAYVILYIKILYRVFGYEIIKMFPILDIVLILGSVGMIAGSILAILQKDLKRVIAYSSVAQMGYIFFGIGLGNRLGLISAIFHILNHAVVKSLLFLVAGAIVEKTREKSIKGLNGIGKEMPVTLGAFSVGALSMVGIPMFPGFISKFNFALASINASKSILVTVILISSLLNALYYFPIVINGFFGEENLKDKILMKKELSISRLLPLIVLVIGVFYLGIASGGLLNILEKAVI